MSKKEESPENQELLTCIEDVVGRRPTYGYRRVTAMVRKALKKPVNFKRVYRLMKKEKLLLQRYGSKPTRTHEGKVATIKSDVRWCSDAFGIQCWNGEQLQWLSDNGPCYVARETVKFGRDLGFEVCTTAPYSPESNGMAEAFVKRMKMDYAYVSDLSSAERVREQLPGWFEDYNENAPHKALKLKSPREYRRSKSAS